jgi:hypothetical protein
MGHGATDYEMTEKMTAFMDRIKEQCRICPQSQQWNQLWEMLPDRTRKGAGWDPPLPLILDGWWYSSDDQKSERFFMHLNWADAHGITDEVLAFLESLSTQDWHTNKGNE